MPDKCYILADRKALLIRIEDYMAMCNEEKTNHSMILYTIYAIFIYHKNIINHRLYQQ